MLVKFVNAFTKSVDQGNPAVVYIVDNFPSSQKMQSLSTKHNVSETVFIKNVFQNDFKIRWFTPISEAPICGHATLASAHILYHYNLVTKEYPINFIHYKSIYSVDKSNNWINLHFPKIDIKRISSNLTIDQIFQNYNQLYLGVSDNIILVELKNASEIEHFVPNFNLISLLPYRALLITSKHEYYDFISRYFAPSVGINEDPVCGSAHCRLIPYWAKKLHKSKMIAYQASKRGGIVKCQNFNDRVIISGQAIITH